MGESGAALFQDGVPISIPIFPQGCQHPLDFLSVSGPLHAMVCADDPALLLAEVVAQYVIDHHA